MTPEPAALVNEEQILLAAVAEVTKRLPMNWTLDAQYERLRGSYK